MARLSLSLVEWPDDPEGGPRLLGQTEDPDLIDAVRARLIAARTKELRALHGPPRVAEFRRQPSEGHGGAPSRPGVSPGKPRA